MTLTPRFGFGFSAILIILAVPTAFWASPGIIDDAALAADDAAKPAADPHALAAPAAPAARLSHVRAGVSSEATTLTLEIGGTFNYVPSASGERLILINLPGVVSTSSAETHLLNSRLASSYRVLPLAEGSRLEILLKTPAAVSLQMMPGALQVRLTPSARTVVNDQTGAASPAAPVQRELRLSASAPGIAVPRGTVIEKVTYVRQDDVTRVQILTNGPVQHRAFQLSGPPRLVLDIPQTESRAGMREIAVGAPPLRSIRVAQFSQSPMVSRVVFDLDHAAQYQVNPHGNVLEVEVKTPGTKAGPVERPQAKPVEAAARVPATLESAPEIVIPPSLETLVARLPALQAAPEGAAIMKPAREGGPAAPAPNNTPAVEQAPAPSPSEQAPAPAEAPAKPAVQEPAPVLPSPTPAPVEAPPAPARAAPPMAPAAVAAPQPYLQQAGQQPAAPAPAEQQPQAPAAPTAPQYTGEPISLNLKDVDLKDFFRLIHEISGLNIVLDPNVSGRVTIVLEDVPWDQALDIVLRNNSLDKQLEGNVLRIARRDTLRKEEEERLALETAKQAAAERVTVMRPLNYGRASALVATLSKFASPKGQIIADDRTNTLIITDIPQVIPVMDDILRTLDRRSLQVEIEARVVAASRQFSREVGAQFGFGTSAATGRSVFMGNSVGAERSPLQVRGFPAPFGFEGDRLPLFSNFPAAGATSGATFIHRSPNLSIDFFISLAETRGIGRLLSRPRIITQNNIQGEVQQGVRIPVQTTVNNTISVQFIAATLRLQVRPQVTNEGTIFLDVSVQNDAIDPGIARINGVPALSTQQATTQVLVNDGGTIVFGGVVSNQNNLSVFQVPLLGSIPVIGHLFKRTGVSTQTNELLFFITPKIV